jgi:guanylate kinase
VRNAPPRGLLFVVSGPSGSGKTTLVNLLLKDKTVCRVLRKSVSFTTRPQRLTEREGRDYFFINQSDFRRKLKAKKILEWTNYLGYYYATPREFVDKQLQNGKNIVLCLDVVGARRIKKLYSSGARTVFIKPPSLESLKERIEGRGKKSGEKGISRRLGLARKELKACPGYDACVVNDDLKQAVRRLKQYIKGEIKRGAR